MGNIPCMGDDQQPWSCRLSSAGWMPLPKLPPMGKASSLDANLRLVESQSDAQAVPLA